MHATILRGAAFALALHTAAHADINVSGRITDTAGSAIEGARVTFTHESSGSAFSSDLTGADGNCEVALSPSSAVLGGTGPAVPTASRLLHNHPNPFNPSTLIPYDLVETGPVRLVVYDVLGRRVRTLVDGVRIAGQHQAFWHGQDASGRPVGAGVYLIRLETPHTAQARKMVLVDGTAGIGVGSGRSAAQKPAVPAEEAPDLYTVTVTGDGIERPPQTGVAVRADTTMDFSVTRVPVPPAETPEQLIENLHRAMRGRDEELYATLLDDDFWFTEFDCQGELLFENNIEEELEILGGSRDGSRHGIFDIYRTVFEFDFSLSSRNTELGREHAPAYAGDPDGHPDEDWETFRGRVQMLMIDENGDGYRVDQAMTFKLRQAEEAADAGAQAVWKMIRWDDDPLSGDCGSAKILLETASWGGIKASMAR